ncbi:MAG: hypothetical protein KDD35_09475 [Bdellovibrionales bacterium]|nr:hypothetical protein [Bdellovibrionales bacterium]
MEKSPKNHISGGKVEFGDTRSVGLSVGSQENLPRSKYKLSSFYKFVPFSQDKVAVFQHQLQQNGELLGLRGLFLIGEEGFNATICGCPDSVDQFKVLLSDLTGVSDIWFKDSYAQQPAFHLFKVKVRPEIVTLDRLDIVPKSVEDHHIEPEEWDALMAQQGVKVIDTRNNYETEIGKFRGALDFGIRNFQEFPEKMKQSDLPKDGKYLIYCTGGIRCEKAIWALREQGYKEVYQLNGGILNYFAQRGASNFEGECFVFDHRVAVDSQLNPSQKYHLCPHCGQTAADLIACQQCHQKVHVCSDCLTDSKHPEYHTCSKNCAHHFRMGHKTERIHLDSFRKRMEVPFSK